VFEDLLTFSIHGQSQSRHERQLLTPCLALSGNATSIAGAGGQIAPVVEPLSGFVIPRQCHALVADLHGPDVASAMLQPIIEGASLIDNLPHLVWTSDVNGIVTAGNTGWQTLAGASTDNQPWTALLIAQEQDAAWSAWSAWRDHVVRDEVYEVQHRLRGPDNSERWALARIMPLRGPDGSLSGWCGSFTDIHALKSREAQLEFLASELTHRIQNIFAVVESLLSLSARSQPQAADFAASACARIRALARANAYIRPQHGTGGQTTLHGLLAILLAPYQMDHAGPATIEITGPDHEIGSASATMLALVVHELATNAAKYGSLSRIGGRVSMNTRIVARRYQLTWTEIGGPAVHEAPANRGFGTLLTDRALRQPLGAEVERLWTPGGLIMKISLPCDGLGN
jgi:two-component sensor histidine kinase